MCNPDIALVPPVLPWPGDSCLWLSHEMPRQGAIWDSLHHTDSLAHHQFKILQHSVQNWLLVLAESNFFGMAGMSWYPSCLTRLMGHSLCSPQWSRLCSCPVAGFGSILDAFFSWSTCWARAHLGTSRLIQDKPVETCSWPGLGFGHWRTRDGQHLCSRAGRCWWDELSSRGQWEWQGCHCPLMEGRRRQFHWAAYPDLPGSSCLCIGRDKMCLLCVYVYIFDTCTAPSLAKGSSAPVLGFMGMLVSICPLACAATGCSEAMWSFLLSPPALCVLRKGCVVQNKSFASSALYMMWWPGAC